MQYQTNLARLLGYFVQLSQFTGRHLLVDPDGEGGNEPFNIYCDMTTRGGGWSCLTPEVVRTRLNHALVGMRCSLIPSVSAEQWCGSHRGRLNFEWLPGFNQFRVGQDFEWGCLAGGEQCDINTQCPQLVWGDMPRPQACPSSCGDISFGTSDATGPSFRSLLLQGATAELPEILDERSDGVMSVASGTIVAGLAGVLLKRRWRNSLHRKSNHKSNDIDPFNRWDVVNLQCQVQ